MLLVAWENHPAQLLEQCWHDVEAVQSHGVLRQDYVLGRQNRVLGWQNRVLGMPLAMGRCNTQV